MWPIRPPVTGTPYEEGNLARNYDALVAEFQRMQAEINRSIAEGGSEESVGATKNKKGGLSGDFLLHLQKQWAKPCKPRPMKLKNSLTI
jgi:hypothetical protein